VSTARVHVPVIIYNPTPLGGDLQAQRRDGVLVLSPDITDVDEVIEIVRESILTMNGHAHRTKYVEKEGYERGADGVLRPKLEGLEGGEKPDRRHTRRPKMEVVR